MLTRCVPCEQNRHGRCQHGQPTLGGDCGCWCVTVKAEAISNVKTFEAAPTTSAPANPEGGA